MADRPSRIAEKATQVEHATGLRVIVLPVMSLRGTRFIVSVCTARKSFTTTELTYVKAWAYLDGVMTGAEAVSTLG